jgi:DNA-binding protein HU-beta
MNKGDIIAQIAAKADISKAAAERALNAIIESITDTLKKGERVAIAGFGTFSVIDRAARKGRNPQTGAEINIPASTAPKFKAGKALKEAVN